MSENQLSRDEEQPAATTVPPAPEATRKHDRKKTVMVVIGFAVALVLLIALNMN